MQVIAATVQQGIVKEEFNNYSPGDVIPSAALDRLQNDDALLSSMICDLFGLYHYPIIATSTNMMGFTTTPDQVTLENNVTLAVGGVVFNTQYFDTLTFTIPDNSTQFLRIEVAPDCGDVVAYNSSPGVVADPIQRKIHENAYITPGSTSDPTGTGGGLSSPTSMLVFQITKGAGGTIPTVTAYANTGSAQSLPTLPVGAYLSWSTGTPPGDYLECNGASLLAADYPDLFGVLGYTYGGAGANFNLPDWRGKFPRGWNHGSGVDPDAATRTGGDTVGSTQGWGLYNHQHGLLGGASAGGSGSPGSGMSGATHGYSWTDGFLQVLSNGGFSNYETRPINMAAMICIKWR
jgi:microcystin-dependent protein